MWPFYLAAVLIVALAGGFLALRARRDALDLKIASVRASGTPTREDGHEQSLVRKRTPYAARGSWILSALPDCFRQRSERRGDAPLPAGARPIRPGATVAAGSCVVHVDADQLEVQRGGDRYGVPPHARLYRFDGGLLLRTASGGRTELRAYRIAPFAR